jgi:hypothetical protein
VPPDFLQQLEGIEICAKARSSNKAIQELLRALPINYRTEQVKSAASN